MKKRLAIVATHVVQYNAPWFALLAQKSGIQVKVFYTWSQSQKGSKYDPGFNRVIEWDIPFLEGYDYEFIDNVSTSPDSGHFMGINNPTLNKSISSWKPDAILIIGWAYKSHLSCMRYFKGKVPVLFRGDSTLLDEAPGFSVKKTARELALKWIYRNVDKALYVGKNNKLYFKKFGLKESQLVYAPHAIDNLRFGDTNNEYENSALEWRRKIGIGDEELVFLFAGKLEPKKGVHFLVKAFCEASLTGSHLVIFGNGVLENELKEVSSSHKNIHFFDFENQSRMPVIYRIGDVFILPSTGPGETWGLAINEAMACGRPVIASDKCGCAPDLVEEGVNGSIVRAGSTDDLTQKLRHFYQNRRTLKQAGKASLVKIQEYSMEKICTAIENIVTIA